MEKPMDFTVARRFKRRDLSWLRTRVNPPFKLRLLKLNGEWDGYWLEQEHVLA
jgi:hypothetical protein